MDFDGDVDGDEANGMQENDSSTRFSDCTPGVETGTLAHAKTCGSTFPADTFRRNRRHQFHNPTSILTIEINILKIYFQL